MFQDQIRALSISLLGLSAMLFNETMKVPTIHVFQPAAATHERKAGLIKYLSGAALKSLTSSKLQQFQRQSGVQTNRN